MYRLGGEKFIPFFILIALSIIAFCAARDMHKRSFVGLGCYGNHDKSKFARLERICEECYMLYRESRLHSMCKRDCFRNDVFTKCVDALLLSDEQKKFEEMANDLHGR